MANVNSFRSSVNTMEQYIYINGVRMNYAEYKKQLKAKEKAKKDEKKAKRAQALIRQLPPSVVLLRKFDFFRFKRHKLFTSNYSIFSKLFRQSIPFSKLCEIFSEVCQFSV